MAFTLSFSKTGSEDFTGKVGSKFTLDMTGPTGAGLVIVAGSYGGATLTAPTFTFQIAAGTQYLYLHFEALVPGAALHVIEVSGQSKQILETLFFDPNNPGTGYRITGA